MGKTSFTSYNGIVNLHAPLWPPIPGQESSAGEVLGSKTTNPNGAYAFLFGSDNNRFCLTALSDQSIPIRFANDDKLCSGFLDDDGVGVYRRDAYLSP